MDVDGIDVSIFYPTVGLLLYCAPDSELLDSIFRTYNDWVGEFCGAFPKRLKAIAMLNVDDVGVGVKELERCAKKGFVGAMIPVYQFEGHFYDKPEYEPLWAAAADHGIPLSLHLGCNRPGPGQEFGASENARPSFVTSVEHWVRMSLADIIFSGAFERYPKLQVGSVEYELSWVPHFLDRLDYTYSQRGNATSTFEDGVLPTTFSTITCSLAFRRTASA